MSGLISHFFRYHPNRQPFAPKQVPKIQDIQAIALVLAIEKLDLSHLNLDFLKTHNIIDADWQLSSTSPQSSAASQITQLNFQNGLTIMGLPKSLIFRETITSEKVNDLALLPVVKRYINYFQDHIYSSVTVNIQRIFNLPRQQSFLNKYTANHLLSQNLSSSHFYPLLQADIHGKYQLERCKLNFRVKVGHLRPQSNKEIPFLLFLAGFKYQTYHFYSQESLKKVKQSLAYLEQDFQVFKTLVEQEFLG